MSSTAGGLRVGLIAALAAALVGGLGGAFTRIGPWYRTLGKPSWTPPDLAFPIIWTIIFILAAVAGGRAWDRAPPAKRPGLIWLFALNGALNAGWSLIFFTLRRPDWALIEALALWLSVLVLIGYLWPVSKPSSLLLVPYFGWVGVAVALNRAVVRLNPPFG